MGNWQNFTISFCVKIWTTYNDYMSFITNRYGSNYRYMNSINSSNQFFFHWTSQYIVSTALIPWTRYNITCAVVNWIYTIYINWTSVETWSYTVWSRTPWLINIGFGYYATDNNTYDERMNWCISEIIIDADGWDATKALDRAKYLGFAN